MQVLGNKEGLAVLEAMLWPVVALAGLTFVVWCVMYQRRISEIRRSGIDPQQLATRESAAPLLTNVTAADNFRNLLEIPVLFYAVCLVIVVTDAAISVQVALAWTFVALRALHSLIHVTYNRVMHRFIVYMLGTICVWAMWAIFATTLASRA